MLHLHAVEYTYPYSDKKALDGVSMHVATGEIVACTGRSGCGKSTLLKIFNGLIPHYAKGKLSGRVMVNGLDVCMQDITQTARVVGSLFQEPERQFFAVTVRDEIGFSLAWHGVNSIDSAVAVEKTAVLLGIESLLESTIFDLSEGQKQKVALASLLVAQPKVLLLDEPTANLDLQASEELATLLYVLKKQGISILVADHRLGWLRHIADQLVILEHGKMIENGPFSIMDDTSFRHRHAVRSHLAQASIMDLPVHKDAENALFSCHNLSFSYPKKQLIIKNFSAAFLAGDRVAIVGKNGVGKTTLARVLTGLQKPKTGEIKVHGKRVRPRFLPRYVQVVLQNASYQLRMRSVQEELDDAAYGYITDRLERQERVCAMIEYYALQHLVHRHPQSLSGGEKQRLSIACAMIRSPTVLILDEPSSGLDQGNMYRIAEMIHSAAGTGSIVLVITHDTDLAIASCHSHLHIG